MEPDGNDSRMSSYTNTSVPQTKKQGQKLNPNGGKASKPTGEPTTKPGRQRECTETMTLTLTGPGTNAATQRTRAESQAGKTWCKRSATYTSGWRKIQVLDKPGKNLHRVQCVRRRRSIPWLTHKPWRKTLKPHVTVWCQTNIEIMNSFFFLQVLAKKD